MDVIFYLLYKKENFSTWINVLCWWIFQRIHRIHVKFIIRKVLRTYIWISIFKCMSSSWRIKYGTENVHRNQNPFEFQNVFFFRNRFSVNGNNIYMSINEIHTSNLNQSSFVHCTLTAQVKKTKHQKRTKYIKIIPMFHFHDKIVATEHNFGFFVWSSFVFFLIFQIFLATKIILAHAHSMVTTLK